jgi:hypothetical protein
MGLSVPSSSHRCRQRARHRAVRARREDVPGSGRGERPAGAPQPIARSCPSGFLHSPVARRREQCCRVLTGRRWGAIPRRGPRRHRQPEVRATISPSASMAHTGTPGTMSFTVRACSTAPPRWKPHGATTIMSGAAALMLSQLVSAERAFERAATGSPPAARTRSGTQCPAVNGGSTHSTTAPRGWERPATLFAMTPRRVRSCLTSWSAVCGTLACSPTTRMVSSTSSSEYGSNAITSARQPR